MARRGHICMDCVALKTPCVYTKANKPTTVPSDAGKFGHVVESVGATHDFVLLPAEHQSIVGSNLWSCCPVDATSMQLACMGSFIHSDF